MELHKWSKSHEEKDHEQGDEKDENLQEEDYHTITTIAITTTIPTTKTERKLTNEQGDKQENYECVYMQLTLLVAQFPPNSIIGS